MCYPSSEYCTYSAEHDNGDNFRDLKELDNKFGFLLDVQKLGGSSSVTLKEKFGNKPYFTLEISIAVTCMLKLRIANNSCRFD